MRQEERDVYVIPPNFIEGGTLMGGMIKTRNAVEAGLLGVLTHEPTYPPLDRTAFLIEHACVPGFYPPYCAEAAQILAAMDACLQKSGQAENGRRSNFRNNSQQ